MIDYIPLSAAAAKRQTTAELRSLAAERMTRLGYPIVASEFAPVGSGCRFDVIGLSRYTRQVRIYEVKSSRADYLADSKWEKYLPFCTHFAFVAPAGVIAKWEIDRDIGLIEYGHPKFEQMLANRRFGFTLHRDDMLRSTRPSRRLRASVEDAQWIALLESLAFSGRACMDADHMLTDGAGI